MTAILWALVATLGAGLIVFGAQLHRMWRQANKREQHITAISNKSAARARKINGLSSLNDTYLEHMADQAEKLRRVTAERDTAIRDGGNAAVAAMKAAARERDEFLASLRAWILIANVGMWVGTTRALPPAERKAIEPPEPPKALPSGDFLVEDQALILQADDEDPFEDYEFLTALPARAEVT